MVMNQSKNANTVRYMKVIGLNKQHHQSVKFDALEMRWKCVENALEIVKIKPHKTVMNERRDE